MDKSSLRTVILFLVMSAAILLVSASPASAQVSRLHHFERAADALELWGDIQGAANLRWMGHNPATVPPELSAKARRAFSRYSECVVSYDQYRRRVRQAILQPVHGDGDQWRVDRAEAALHLVAYEMEQGTGRGGGSMPLIRHYLHDAWWSLNHHIATALIAPPTIPPTAEIAVSPDLITRGEGAVLTWNTSNATTAEINGEEVSLNGQRTVSPMTTIVYDLVATGAGGRATDRTVLNVSSPPAPTAELNVRPNRITEGDCATLNWTTRNATRATINGEVVDANGEMRVCPTESITYELLATGPGGRATDREIVTVTFPPVTHHRVNFDFDEAFIREDAKDTMAMVAEMMRESPGLQMRIEGHCDWKGTDAYNMELGMRRAESARDYFVNIYGISPSRLTLVSYGESRPIAENAFPDGQDNPEGRQMNRRAVFAPVR